MTGTAAPSANETIEPIAAPHGDPSSSGSRPELLAYEDVERGFGILEQAVGDAGRLVAGEALRAVRGRQLGLLLLGHRLHLGPFELDLSLEQLALALHADVLAGGHAERPCQQAGDPGEKDEGRVCGRRAGNAHDQRQVAHEAVTHAEDDRAEGARSSARAMPRLPPGDLGGVGGPSGWAGAVATIGDGLALGQTLPDLCVLALVGGDRRDLGRSALTLVGLFLVTLEGLHELGDRAGPEQPGDEHDDAHPRPWAVGGWDGRTQLGQLAGPDVGVPPLVRRDPAEGFRPGLVLLDLGERVVEDDRVTFELEILEAGREVDGRHAAHRTRVRVLAAYVAPVSHDAGPPPRLAVQ